MLNTKEYRHQVKIINFVNLRIGGESQVVEESDSTSIGDDLDVVVIYQPTLEKSNSLWNQGLNQSSL